MSNPPSGTSTPAPHTTSTSSTPFKSDPYRSLIPQLTALDSLVATLKQNHTALREENQTVVKTALWMDIKLAPVEDGMRRERENRARMEAERRVKVGIVGDGEGEAEEGGKEEVGVVGGGMS